MFGQKQARAMRGQGMNFSKRVLISSISISIVLVLNFATLVFAQTFNPAFTIELSDTTPSAHPNIRLLVVQDDPLDDPFKKVVFTIPAGFDIASSASLAASVPPGFPLEPATGNLSMSGFDGGVQIFNVADAQGHKALWRMVPGPTTVDIIVDGDSTSGHTVTFEWPAEFVPTLFGPISRFELIINGQTNAPAAPKVVTNPSKDEETIWKAEIVSKGGQTKTLEAKPSTFETSSSRENVKIAQATPAKKAEVLPKASVLPKEATAASLSTKVNPLAIKKPKRFWPWLLGGTVILIMGVLVINRRKSKRS